MVALLSLIFDSDVSHTGSNSKYHELVWNHFQLLKTSERKSGLWQMELYVVLADSTAASAEKSTPGQVASISKSHRI